MATSLTIPPDAQARIKMLSKRSPAERVKSAATGQASEIDSEPELQSNEQPAE